MKIWAYRRFSRVTQKPRIIIGLRASGQGKSTTLAPCWTKSTTAGVTLLPLKTGGIIYQADKSIIDQREVMTDTLGFAEALKSTFAESGCHYGGEMRDLETISTTITARNRPLGVCDAPHQFRRPIY